MVASQGTKGRYFNRGRSVCKDPDTREHSLIGRYK